MKTQVLIEDGVSQIVLTPETKFEVALLQQVNIDGNAVILKRGVFAECAGGYIREFNERPNKESLMVVIKRQQEAA